MMRHQSPMTNPSKFHWFDTAEVQDIVKQLQADGSLWSVERVTDWNPRDNGKSERVIYSGGLIDRLRAIRNNQIDVALDYAELSGDRGYATALMSQPDVDDWLGTQL